MKSILFACFLLTATCSVGFVQQVTAQTATTVSATDFTAKVNQMDTQIGASDMTNANATWLSIHNLMKAELAATKSKIAGAATTTDKRFYSTLMNKQIALYQAIWKLKADLTTNRATIHSKLGEFANTIQ